MAKNVNIVTWFEIYVEDMDRAKKFYGSVLDEEMTDMPLPEGSEEGMKMVSFPWVENAPNEIKKNRNQMGHPFCADGSGLDVFGTAVWPA